MIEEPETVSKGEVAQQAAQVAQDIQGNMGQTVPPYQYPPLDVYKRQSHQWFSLMKLLSAL